jgi:hypothetical protein
MKLGKLMVTGAILLVLTAFRWALVTAIEDKPIRHSMEELSPTQLTSSTVRYETNEINRIEINAAVNVILDDSFQGIELQGDTSCFKQLVINASSFISKSQKYYSIIIDDRVKYKDSDSITIKYIFGSDKDLHKKVSIRMGVKHTNGLSPQSRWMDFTNCPSVVFLQSYKCKNLELNLSNIDTIDIKVALENLELSTQDVKFETVNNRYEKQENDIIGSCHIRGSAQRLYIDRLTKQKLLATQLAVEEVYINDLVTTNVYLNAPNLTNVRYADTSSMVHYLVPPKYERKGNKYGREYPH